MKTLITLITLTTLSSSMACTLTLTKTSLKAKSAKLDGVSISKKVQAALSTQCSIKYRTLTDAEKRAAKIIRLKKQLKKLGA